MPSTLTRGPSRLGVAMARRRDQTRLSPPERQLVLLSAGTAARRQAMSERAQRLMSDVDWSRVAATLGRRKLMSVLGRRIVELGQGRASREFVSAVEESVQATTRHGAFLLLINERLISRLAAAGIRSSPLKGPTLGEAIYGEPGMRISSDIDLLVAGEQLQSAVTIMRGMGYAAPTDHVDRRGLPQLHYALAHEEGILPPVELHWRIHWYEECFARDRLLPPAAAALGSWRPAPADELAALLLFYARDGFADLRLATDLGAWWDTFGAGLSRGALEDVCRAYPPLRRAIRVAARVARDTVGLPLERLIDNSARIDFRDRMAERLANPNPRGGEAQVHANVVVVDGLLTPTGGYRAFLRRDLVIPRPVFDRYAGKSPEWRVRSPLTYGLRILARAPVSAVHAARGSERLDTH
jgi:hypothetical protein